MLRLQGNSDGDSWGCAVAVNMQLLQGMAGLTITTSKHNLILGEKGCCEEFQSSKNEDHQNMERICLLRQ